MKRTTVILLILFSLLLLLTLPFCNNSAKKPATAKSRQTLLQECAKCHPKEYANEQMGPHANSFTRLQKYLNLTQTSPNFPKEYAAFVAEKFAVSCTRCHASENLYDHQLVASIGATDLTKLLKEHSDDFSQMPHARTDSIEWISGVDCLSCHQTGDNVAATALTRADRTAACKPMGNVLFADKNNCLGCHGNLVASLQTNAHNPAVKEMACINCHMEKDEQGKLTHYMYWRHDPEQKKKPEVRAGIFDDFVITAKREKGKAVLAMEWANKRTPHRFSEVEDIIVVISVINEKLKIIAQDTIRNNCKKWKDPNLIADIFHSGTVPGSPEGYSFLPSDSTFKKSLSFSLGKSAAKLNVKIVGFVKPQYWTKDAAAQKVYERNQPLNL